MANKEFNLDEFMRLDLNKLVFRVKEADTGEFISYDPDKCNGCGECELVCSASLWAATKGQKAKLSPKYRQLCMECGACYAVCEADAISFNYPAGGSGIIIKHG